MSRRAREEMPFGSDSFLDVLANIVGILIILIVAAAARMGRAPDLSLLTQVAAPTRGHFSNCGSEPSCAAGVGARSAINGSSRTLVPVTW